MAGLATTSIVIQFLGVHVTVITGGGAVATTGSVLVAVIVVVLAWAFGHLVGTPAWAFADVGRAKWHWVLAMTLLFLATDTTIVIVALYYLVRVRPRLNDAMRRTDTVAGPVSDSLVRSRA